jgi:3-oxoacyl-[acyl-carrier protein] reductase
MDLGLKNKTVIVTGGASGLGAAICAEFENEGAHVVVFDLSKNMSPQKDGLLHVIGDVTNPKDIDQAFQLAINTFGEVDILVNNAGIWPDSRFVDMPVEEWERTLNVNLTGPFLFSQKFIRHLMDEKRPGQIINIVSPVAFQGSTGGHSHYAAAKAGLVSLTQSLAREVSAAGIRMVAVAPGVMCTDMTSSTIADRGAHHYLDRIPLGRFGEPAEVASVVVFMASERASYVTGATIDVTGGMLMR